MQVTTATYHCHQVICLLYLLSVAGEVMRSFLYEKHKHFFKCYHKNYKHFFSSFAVCFSEFIVYSSEPSFEFVYCQ